MTLSIDDSDVHFVGSKYSCGWIAVVTQATMHKIGSNLVYI